AVGIPSDLGEDDILVVVTLRPGADMKHAELLDFCSARMPYFCVPRYLEVLDEMPKNVIGRVRKDVLRSRGLGVGAWDREAHGYVLNRPDGRKAHDLDIPTAVRSRRAGGAGGDPQPGRAPQSAVLSG